MVGTVTDTFMSFEEKMKAGYTRYSIATYFTKEELAAFHRLTEVSGVPRYMLVRQAILAMLEADGLLPPIRRT